VSVLRPDSGTPDHHPGLTDSKETKVVDPQEITEELEHPGVPFRAVVSSAGSRRLSLAR
jgi:hypothetical protein